MKKIMLRALVIAVLVVNLLGWLVGVYSEVEIGALFRIALIVGILFITAIVAGAALIVGALDKESRDHDPD